MVFDRAVFGFIICRIISEKIDRGEVVTNSSIYKAIEADYSGECKINGFVRRSTKRKVQVATLALEKSGMIVREARAETRRKIPVYHITEILTPKNCSNEI
jgi:hypothetical protein